MYAALLVGVAGLGLEAIVLSPRDESVVVGTSTDGYICLRLLGCFPTAERAEEALKTEMARQGYPGATIKKI